MATHAETKIAEALLERVATIDDAVPVAWPNTSFDPPEDRNWLRPTILPAEPVKRGVANSGCTIHEGILQVDVFAAENEGITTVSERAGAVGAHFAKGTVMARDGIQVHVKNPPAIGRMDTNQGEVQIPVSVPYVAFI